ncbi:MAG: hypothetical protein ACTSWQ_08855 [Candidatus Thorarchaeota archaeon]
MAKRKPKAKPQKLMVVEEPMKHCEDVTKKLAELHEEFRKFAQVKSDFQIEKFSVVSEGSSRSHQYRHGLKQIEVGLYQVKLWLIQAEGLKRKMARWEKRAGNDDDLRILKAKTELQRLELSVIGRMREIEKYNQICDFLKAEFGPFTAEDYQRDEAAYYAQRLAKQALATGRREGAGNWMALLDASAETVLPDSPHRFTIPGLTEKGELEEAMQIALGEFEIKRPQLDGGNSKGVVGQIGSGKNDSEAPTEETPPDKASKAKDKKKAPVEESKE